MSLASHLTCNADAQKTDCYNWVYPLAVQCHIIASLFPSVLVKHTIVCVLSFPEILLEEFETQLGCEDWKSPS